MNDEELFDRIALNVKVERTKKRLTQAALAELIDVHEKYIGKIENGRQNVTIKTLNKLANALNVNINKFFDRQD